MENNNKRQRRMEEEEEAILAQAIEASLLHQDEVVARKLQKTEQEAADEELAAAFSASQEQEEFSQSMNAQIHHWRRSASEERNLGSWDCTVCTLTNQPYQRHCRACDTQAPPHVLVFETMTPLKFGLEIEMIIPQGKRDGFTLESIAKDLTSLGPEKVRFRSYTHETTDYWKLVTDASIVGQSSHNDLCFELVSPILQGETGLASLRSIMDNIRRLGIATNASCGFHVHVDANQQSLAGLKRISQCFVSLENAFDLLVALTWEDDNAERRANANRYCRSNRLAFGEQSNRQRWRQIGSAQTLAELVDLMNSSQDRYRKLNLTNLTKEERPSTCEFRHHGGVEDLQEAEAWVRLVVAFCQNAAQCGPTTKACLLPETATPRNELEVLFRLVNCEGLEQFFVVERRLFAEHRLRNEWQCRACYRKFANSRALSQHALASGHGT